MLELYYRQNIIIEDLVTNQQKNLVVTITISCYINVCLIKKHMLGFILFLTYYLLYLTLFSCIVATTSLRMTNC